MLIKTHFWSKCDSGRTGALSRWILNIERDDRSLTRGCLKLPSFESRRFSLAWHFVPEQSWFKKLTLYRVGIASHVGVGARIARYDEPHLLCIVKIKTPISIFR